MKPFLFILSAISFMVGIYYFIPTETETPTPTLNPMVEVTKVTHGSFDQSIKLIGNSFANHSVDIYSEVSGRINTIYVKSGQHVKKDTLLFELDNRHQKAVVLRERAKLEESERHLNNIEKLLPKGAVKQTEYDQALSDVTMQKAELQLAKASLEDTYVKAPFNGKLGLVDLSPGQLVSADTRLTTLDDSTVLKLNVPISSQYLSKIKQGDIAEFSSFESNQPFQAKVHSLDTRIQEQSQNIQAQFIIQNKYQKITPGSLITGELSFKSQPENLIPLQAVVYQGHQRFVYRLVDETVQKTPIVLGTRNQHFVQVLDGIKQGDTIVHKGTVKLRDGMTVDIKS